MMRILAKTLGTLGAFLLLGGLAFPAQAEQRVVAVGSAITEIIYALGAESSLVGNDTTGYYPEAAKKLPKVGYQRNLSAEGILSLRPNLMIFTQQAGPPPVLAQLKAAGIKMLPIESGKSIADVKASIKTIGDVLGKPQQAAELIANIDKQMKELAKITATQPHKQRVIFVLGHGGGPPMVAGKETEAEGIIELSGGINVVSEYKGYKPLTPEAIVALKPDVILITARGIKGSGGKEALLATPGISLTPAAKNGNVIVMDSLLLLGFGPRAVEAAIQLNKELAQTNK